MFGSKLISRTGKPELDPGFLPAAIWTRQFQERVQECGDPQPIALCLERPDGTVSVHRTRILPHRGNAVLLNNRYVERLMKTLLWLKGGWKLTIAGERAVADHIREHYCETGPRAFDFDHVGMQIYGRPLVVKQTAYKDAPEPNEATVTLGRHMKGCRIGFDLGGSDRKCAAVIDGHVVFSEEVPWDPYFQSDSQFHYDGINDSLKRAAAHLPRVDAIGGSAAGVYVNNEVRAASLFRGVSRDDFERRVRRIFHELRKEWGNVNFEVINDGEVAALGGSMVMGENAVLGVAMGTSEAAGYVDRKGMLTNWLNELAFVPIDFREDGPRDEWSGDRGCGAQYFSQQAVGRLLGPAGIELDEKIPLPEKLVLVQEMVEKGNESARLIFETIGTYFGYSVALYAEFYEISNLLLFGRVLSGTGGEIILSRASRLLSRQFPELHEIVRLTTPDETAKRLGQAAAAASLPE